METAKMAKHHHSGWKIQFVKKKKKEKKTQTQMNHLSKRGFSYKAQHCGQMATSELQYKKIKMTVVIAHVTDFSL